VIQSIEVDGRKARGLRTRDAIVTALMDLVAEGDATPTAQRVADRAGVSVRSVYQHFTDVEGLFSQASDRLNLWLSEHQAQVDTALPLLQRIDVFVSGRAENLETLAPFSRASRLLEPSSATLTQSRADLVARARDRLAQIFAPELNGLAEPSRTDLLDALDIQSSLDGWNHMRERGTEVAAARRVMTLGLRRLLTPL
jgi:TetR/AcrR family transcriptional regulator, regulator of autoinduction and epiphytic fitness